MSDRSSMAEAEVAVVAARLESLDEAEAVLRLLGEYAEDPMGGGRPLASHVRANLIEQLRQRDSAHVLLAYVGDEAAGLLIAFEGFSTFACRPLLNIHDVIVSKRFRGRGVSRQLLQGAEDLARRLDCCKLTLEVLEGNRVAQAAYRSFGFAGYELDPAAGEALFWQKTLG